MRQLAIWVALTSLVASAEPSAATIDVQVVNFRYVPNDITIQAGDTVRWTNQGGLHNVRADDGSFGNNASNDAWVFSRTFNTPGEVRYHCQIHSGPGQDINQAMNGRITVDPAGTSFAINQGIAGAWFNSATGGQGFMMEVRPSDRFFFVAWFTFDDDDSPGAPAGAKLGDSDQIWLTAQGNYDGATAQIPIFNTVGGRFNNNRPTTTTQVGTMTVSFTSCTAGTVTYSLPGDSLQGVIPIQRVVPGTEALCQTLAAGNTAQATPDAR
jgi:plastocyanin